MIREQVVGALRSPLLPIWLVVALLPLGRSSELGTLLCLLGTVWLAWRHGPQLWRLPSVRMLAMLFAAYLGAALLSLPDAINPGKSWGTVLAVLRYAPFGVFVCWAMQPPKRAQHLYRAVALVVMVWVLDAWLQIFTGWSLGGPAEQVRVSGIFGAENLKLGPALASLAPFVLWSAHARFGRRGLVLAFVLLLVPILLAGARQAWLSYALISAAFAWQVGRTPLRAGAWLSAALLVAVLAMLAAWQWSPRFAQRMDRSAQILQGSEKGVDTALSGRLRIWRTAGNMIAAHPVNGVGVRDFRYAYPNFARPGDRFVGVDACGPGEGACHPHQWLLEVASGTGLIGLFLWFAGIFIAVRGWWRSNAAARERAFPATVAVAAAIFPLNTHLAFYSAWWGLLFWWLLAVWCATLFAGQEGADAA